MESVPGYFWFSEPSFSPERRVVISHSTSAGVHPVTPAARATLMRGREALPSEWLLYTVRPWANRTHLSGPGGAHLALFVVLNHSCWSLLRCYSTSTGAVVTPVQPLPGTGNQVSKDVRDREKGKKQTEPFGEYCC